MVGRAMVLGLAAGWVVLGGCDGLFGELNIDLRSDSRGGYDWPDGTSASGEYFERDVEGGEGEGDAEVSQGAEVDPGPSFGVCASDDDCVLALAVEGPCATAWCDAGACRLRFASAGTACELAKPLAECRAAMCDGMGQCVVGLAADGAACRGGERTDCTRWECTAGACGQVAEDCDDGIACTEDHCWEGVGCQHRPRHALCDDGDACTTDVCSKDEGCVHPSVAAACDDGNPCTEDGCDPERGCVHTAVTGACDDGNPCTVVDACVEGHCVALSEYDCDDGNPCTDDACDRATGACVSTPNTAPCADDGLPCTADVCSEGVCTHPPAPTGSPCTDGNACTAGDRCVSGACQWKQLVDCNDGDPCTVDACHPVLGCVHTPSSLCQ